MGKILAKQIKGGVDLNSDQVIEGKKTFSAPIIYQNKESSHQIVNTNGFIYWVIDPEKLEQDGNFRQGIIKGNLSIQQYYDKEWITTDK